MWFNLLMELGDGSLELDTNMKGTVRQFSDLNAWKAAFKLTLLIYEMTRELPKYELYGITSQIRRSSMSVAANIAEGFGRQTPRDRLRFYFIASGSITETKNYILLIQGLNYIDGNGIIEIKKQLITAHKLLHGLINSTRKGLTPNS